MDHILDGKPFRPYAYVLGRIRDAARQTPKGTSNRDDWETAIAIACDYERLQPWGDDSVYARANVRKFAVARAALRLRERGFQLTVENGRPRLEAVSEQKIVEKLETLIRTLGGINTAAQILDKLQPFYDSVQQRYHLVRRVALDGSNSSPYPPFGYLLLLAVKYPALQVEPPYPDQDWRELVQLSTDYAALFDVQPYTHFESMFKGALFIVPFLQELAVYDNLFRIQQMRPGDAIKIARGVLSWLDIKQEYDGAWSISEVLTVAERVLNEARSLRKPAFIKACDVVMPYKGMYRRKVSKILKDVLSHPLSGANQSFTRPTDVPGPDFFLRPLFQDGHGGYCLLDASVCAPAVIEALFSQLRKFHQEFDKRVGEAMESFLRHELQQRRVKTCGGKYRVGGEDGECDIVVETSNTVIFVEVKKKPFTRKARAGSDVAILLDLAESLLDAQLQAGWHEVRLRRQGFVDLLDGNGQAERLSLNGRGVERIAVTLFDYGSFQDRILLQEFLGANLDIGRYSAAVDGETRKKFAALNVKIASLKDQVRQLVNLQPNDSNVKQHPFFHCWFLSLPQILVLLDSVNSNDDFRNALWSTRHAWTGSQDFYFDHAAKKKLWR